jgi:hypothetical protein
MLGCFIKVGAMIIMKIKQKKTEMNYAENFLSLILELNQTMNKHIPIPLDINF